MHAVSFDTLSYAKRLEAKGVPTEQAEAHAQALAEVLEERVTSKQETNDAVGRLSNDISLLRQEIKTSVADVKSEVIKWVFGISFAQAALIISALKFLH